MIKIVIVEDEKEYSDALTGYLHDYEKEKNLSFEIETFSNPIPFLDTYDSSADIIFFDIGLPSMNGMDLAKKIRAKDDTVSMVFLTSLSQYAIEGYEVSAVDFVLKPIVYSRLKIILDKTLLHMQERSSQWISLKTTSGIVRIDALEVIYVKVNDHLLYFKTKNREYECWDSLKNALAILPSSHFCKISKSVILNLNYVGTMNKKDIVLKGGTAFAYSPLLKDEIMEKLNQLL